ncbi:hypothetical protein OQA88_882 [Cercophora sp. LCS_1]
MCFVGAGFVGGPTAAVIAYHNPTMNVDVVDLNEDRILAWNSSHLPIHEDGLLRVVRIARDGTLDDKVSVGSGHPARSEGRSANLVFSTKVAESIAKADIVFICVNTPTKSHGIGAGAMADVSAVESATKTVAKHAQAGAIIVEKSTVPCGTARVIQDILRYHRPDADFEVLSNPEFLAEGTAVENLMRPDRILIGSSQTPSGLQAASAVRGVYAAWVPAERILTVNTFSSELAKLVANAMLAQRISSINAVSAMCEEIGLGADVDDVSLAVGKDNRVGSRFLHAGVGFGGSCFEKDILSLAYLARELRLDVVADYWLSILKINEHQRQRFTRSVVSQLNGSLRGKKIAVLGFAFKDGTNDTRNSIAIHIIRDLAEEMPREIAVFDPGCSPGDIMDEIQRIGLTPGQVGRIKVCTTWRQTVKDANAVAVLTQWRHFKVRGFGRSGRETRDPDDSGPMLVTGSDESDGEAQECGFEEVTQQGEPSAVDPPGRLKPLPLCPGTCGKCRESVRGGDRDVGIDWIEVASMMQEPRWVFDGRNVLDTLELDALGFKVKGIGKG